MITAPFVILVYDRVFAASSFKELFRRRWALHLGLTATWALLLTLLVLSDFKQSNPTTTHTLHPALGRAWLPYALTQFGVIVRYLRLRPGDEELRLSM